MTTSGSRTGACGARTVPGFPPPSWCTMPSGLSAAPTSNSGTSLRIGWMSWPSSSVTSRRPEQRTHDYVRHGTTTLFAALEVATGRIIDQCTPRHRHQEFLAFLKQVARSYPRRQLHVICDNYATHKHPAVRAWLAKHPRIQLHFTPTSASWLNLIEVFFSIVERQALRRGDFPSVTQLTAAIGRFCQSWNEHCQPFSWTKPTDQILAKLNRQTTSATKH